MNQDENMKDGKYEEALERAKQGLPIDEVFPELKESEDERIRNLIYCIVRDRSDVGKLLEANGCPVEKALSWIEEQKEPKLESCDCSRDEESYTNGIHHVLMNPEAYGLIKQKPAEQLGGTCTSYDMAKTFTEGQNYVIAHPEKFGLCKPAEWKEEDEGMLNCIIATLCEESHGGRESNGKMVTWLENRLKSLRPQPTCEIYKSAKHDLAIRFMNYLDENRPNGKMSLSNGECEDIDKAFNENDWAKIIRYVEKYSPSWKPSKEQPIEGKQVIIITETDGDANIHWDCRSLDDVMALLTSAKSFIADKQIEKLRGQGSGPDYNTTEGRFRNAHKFQQEQPECIYGRTPEEREKCCKFCSAICEARIEQEQPEIDLEKEIECSIRFLNGHHTLENGERWYKGRYEELRDFARHFYGLRNRALEEAARHIYESWMGGTMDDVRRDMVELGRVINARKEE